MANTMTLVAYSRLAAAATYIDLLSIPATYTDLVLIISQRAAGNALDNGLRFNNDAGSVYSFTQLQSGASTGSPGTARNSNSTLVRAGGMEPNTYLANTFNSTTVYIPNYAGSNFKSLIADGANENNSTTNYAWFHAGLWRNTAAINRITLYLEGGGNLDTGTEISLYGIKNTA
jgi:hypothetical protein